MCTEHRTSGGAGIIGPLVVCGVISLTVFAAFTGLFQAAVSMLPIVFAAGLVTAGGVVFAWSRSWFTTPPVLVPDGHEWGDICQVCNIAGCSVTHVLADATAHVGPVCAPCIETHGAPVDTATTAVVELAKTAELAVRAVAQGRLADADVMRFVAGGIGALPHPTSVEQLLHRAVGAQITEALTVNDQDAVVQMERLRVALIEAARERVGILR